MSEKEQNNNLDSLQQLSLVCPMAQAPVRPNTHATPCSHPKDVSTNQDRRNDLKQQLCQDSSSLACAWLGNRREQCSYPKFNIKLNTGHFSRLDPGARGSSYRT